ncbi:aminotransferase-like domain-containing protein [Mariniluteicoccus flavus]
MSASDSVTASWLSTQIADPSAAGIAAEISQLIKHGDLAPGTRLPSVRALADALNVSPSTVSAAWQRLRARNMIVGGGRGGTKVATTPGTPRPERYEAVGDFGDDLALDLRLSVPAPDLLPRLTDHLRQLDSVPDLNSYERIPVTANLEAALQHRWPFTPRTMMVANGGYEALMLVVYTFIQAGDHVAVENPSPARVLDIVEGAGGRPVFVERDREGIVPATLIDALARRPAALILQPGIHNPDGATMSARRRDELVDLLRGKEILVIENDGLGQLALDPVVTVSEKLPDQSVYVRSFSKSHGPDLRLAVLDGPAARVERVQSYRAYGSGWTSRVLQEVLAAMLQDPACDRVVERARHIYDNRRETLRRELATRGVHVDGGGLDLWIPVHNEQFALVTCAARGIAVNPGARFLRPGGQPHIRVSTSQLDTDRAAYAAEVLALAVGPR